MWGQLIGYVRGWVCGGLGIKGARVSMGVGKNRVSRDGVGYPLVYPLKGIWDYRYPTLPRKEHGTRDTIPHAPSELWLMQDGGTHPTRKFSFFNI